MKKESLYQYKNKIYKYSDLLQVIKKSDEYFRYCADYVHEIEIDGFLYQFKDFLSDYSIDGYCESSWLKIKDKIRDSKDFIESLSCWCGSKIVAYYKTIMRLEDFIDEIEHKQNYHWESYSDEEYNKLTNYINIALDKIEKRTEEIESALAKSFDFGVNAIFNGESGWIDCYVDDCDDIKYIGVEYSA